MNRLLQSIQKVEEHIQSQIESTPSSAGITKTSTHGYWTTTHEEMRTIMRMNKVVIGMANRGELYQSSVATFPERVGSPTWNENIEEML